MKICLITGEYPPMQGGVGDYTHELAKAYIELGHQVVVLTSVRGTGEYAYEEVTPADQAIVVRPVATKWRLGRGAAIRTIREEQIGRASCRERV